MAGRRTTGTIFSAPAVAADMTLATATPRAADASEASVPRSLDRWGSVMRHAILAFGVYVPLLLTARGRVVADTKQYLYLDPTRLLERAPFMWDPNIGLGTVTHQNIGYLFPMGPWFWLFQQIGVPDWVAQRLWLATIMFAAGSGVLFLLRSLGWRSASVADAAATDIAAADSGLADSRVADSAATASGARPGASVSDRQAADPGRDSRLVQVMGGGALAAAALYMLTPFVLENAARFSVLLLPWAGLPWLLGLTQRALRSGSWRHPALFAIVVTIVGGVNATALILAGIAPLLWVPFAVWVHREVTLRRALGTVARIGVLSFGCSLWWIAGLSAQGGYGLDVLEYSETVQAVARTSMSSEVLRGLGYWFFYGGDKVGPWIEPSHGYIQHLWLLAVGFAVPVLAIVAAVITRWRYRAFFVAIPFVGTAVAVGAFPYGSPSPLGALFKALATSSTAGLAMRSTARAVPLVVLGLAVLIGAGLAALARRLPRPAATLTALVVLLAVVGLPVLWTGRFFGKNLQRDEDVPKYWDDAAHYLDGRGKTTRVLEIPGSDFASYRWGTTIDPITPGIMDRPYAARELIPWGSAPSADLMIALDRQLQDGFIDPSVLAPVARLMGVGDIVLRSDLEFERYRLARPKALWALLRNAPEGLDAPVAFGRRMPNRAIARLPLDRDAIELAIPRGTPAAPPVAVFGVKNPVPIVRAEANAKPLLLAGDGEGVIEAAEARLLGGQAPLFYSAALTKSPALRTRLLRSDARLVLTDSNRRRGRRWTTVFENTGYTEQAGEKPLKRDLTDNRLPLFPDAGDDEYTTVQQRGVRQVSASAYGNPVTLLPEDRPANAFDGDPATSWRVGDFSDVQGERLQVELTKPTTTDHVDLVQPLVGARNRFITRIGVLLDGHDIGTFSLDQRSRERSGQRVDIGRHRFSKLELMVRGDNIGALRRYDGISAVGIAELRVGTARVDEVVRLPSEMLGAAGSDSASHELDVLLSRERSDPVDPGREDEEESMVRTFSLPTSRTFALTGDARISAHVPAPAVDRLLGFPAAGDGGYTVSSSSYLRGILGTRATVALDGDPATAWQPAFGEASQIGAWLDVKLPQPVKVDHLSLVLTTDGNHSVPTRLRIEGGGRKRTVQVPPLTDRRGSAATTPITVRFAPVTAAHLRVVVEAVRPVKNTDYYSEQPVFRPIGVAELGIPGVRPARAPAQLSGACRKGLLRVDGRPVGLRITGSAKDAGARSALRVSLCGKGDGGLTLGPGTHLLRAAKGKRTGIDLDRLALASAARPSGAVAVAASSAASTSSAAAGGTPQVKVTSDGRTNMKLQVRGATKPFWLVLGQSYNQGWTAKIAGGASLGKQTVVDGYANGWYVDPKGRRELGVTLAWTPQRSVWVALALSSASFALCLVLALWGWRRRPSQVGLTRASRGVGPALPELSSPLSFARDASRLRPVQATVLAVSCGVVAGLVVSPLVGVGTLAAVALSLRRGRYSRAVITGGAVAAVGLTAAFVLARQVFHGGPPADFTWVTYFEPAHVLAWIALVFLAADVVIELVLRRSPPRTDPVD